MQGRTFTESLFLIRYQAPAPLIDMHPLWSARARFSLDRRRRPSLIFQDLPGRLIVFSGWKSSLKHPAGPKAETRQETAPPMSFSKHYTCGEIWGSLQGPSPGRVTDRTPRVTRLMTAQHAGRTASSSQNTSEKADFSRTTPTLEFTM